MKRTLSEIQATCTKAARGAGCPWGLAEDAGMAARVLEAHGVPGVAALAALFDTPRACPCTGHSGGAICGIAALVALSDEMPEEMAELGPVASPLLLAAACIMDGAGWRVAWPGGRLETGPDGVALIGRLPEDIPSVTVTRAIGKGGTSPDWRSRDVPDAAWVALEALAARTYVPETDASRAKGAGPDTADQD